MQATGEPQAAPVGAGVAGRSRTSKGTGAAPSRVNGKPRRRAGPTRDHSPTGTAGSPYRQYTAASGSRAIASK
jgi:hypothetical protein